MRYFISIVLCLVIQKGLAQKELGVIGSWRSHYNNYTITQVVKGDQYYAATKNQIISIDDANNIQYIGKVEGLHEIGIQKIAWDSIGEQLIIAYQNSSIDIKQGEQVYLINAIKNTTLFNQKQIEYIKVKSPLAFIGTGFGIVVIDLQIHEIKETWTNEDIDRFNSTYPYINNLSISNIPFKTDIDKGIALYPDSTNWIDIPGPRHPIKGKMSVIEKQLIAPYSGTQNGLCFYDEKGWHQLEKSALPIFDFSTPSNVTNKAWLTSPNKLYQIDFSNSTIDSVGLDKSSQHIVDLTHAIDGTPWILNQSRGLQAWSNNQWSTFPVPTNSIFTNQAQMISSQSGQLWMAAPQNQGLLIYQTNNTNKQGAWFSKTTSPNNGNLPSNAVTSIIEDLSGQIWVGTDNGIAIFQCDDLSSNPCNAYLPIVNNNGFNAYLFQKETVQCMAVDGANRKWIGTNNGLWLISPDGLEILEHFTSTNSPLPTDSITQIIIEPNSGEVFINTSEELVSYRGTATSGSNTQEALFIFPNPVPPEMNGLITIKKITNNALVKITDINGKLVFQTRALGGQAIWNGRTYEGNKVASGMYLVFVQNNEGTEKTTGKILIL